MLKNAYFGGNVKIFSASGASPPNPRFPTPAPPDSRVVITACYYNFI